MPFVPDTFSTLRPIASPSRLAGLSESWGCVVLFFAILLSLGMGNQDEEGHGAASKGLA